MSPPPLNLGAFGVGRMGLVHVENLVRLSREQRVNLVALGDRQGATLLSACALVGELGGAEMVANLGRFNDSDEMAVAAGVDAVVVSSRTEDHARDTLAFARRGIPVLVEKPLAGSVAEVLRLSNALGGDGNCLVQVGFQRHYDAATQSARKWVADGLIGAIQQSHHVLQDKNPTPVGYQSCGITADMAIHLVFEAMSFHDFELPRQVQALRFMAPHYEDRAGEGANVIHAFCNWADGSMAHLWGSRINNAGYDNGFKLIGGKGRIDVGEFIGDFGTICAKRWNGVADGLTPKGTLVESLEFRMTRPEARHPDFYARFATAYATELRVFVDSVRAGTPFVPPLEIGWKTLLVANLAEESSRREGRRFDLVLRNGKPIGDVNDASEFAQSIGLA